MKFKKLMKEEKLFIKIVSNLPWYEIFPEHKNKIINYLEKKYNNLKILKINDIYDLNELVSQQPFYQSFGKIYFYDYNGSTISKKISKKNDQNYESVMKNSIYMTFNVFAFIIVIYNFAKANNFIYGYRPMRSSPRESYNKAIEYINDNYDKTIIEPRNIKFNEQLSKYSYSLPINDRSTLAIYDIFKKIVDDIF